MDKIKLEIERWLNESQNDNRKSRSELVTYLVENVYKFVKFERPEGGGLDGRDGPERQGIANVVDAAKDYYFDTLQALSNRK